MILDNSNKNRRAHTEIPDGYNDAYQTAEGPGNYNTAGHDNNEADNDLDAQQDLTNYKGIYADEGEGGEGGDNVKYTCPQTGAHFEYNDLCKRMKKVQGTRVKQDQNDQALLTAKAKVNEPY
jgi:hypothetical protein